MSGGVALVTNKQAGEARDEMVQEFCFGWKRSGKTSLGDDT